MKRVLVAIISALVMISMVACGNSSKTEEPSGFVESSPVSSPAGGPSNKISEIEPPVSSTDGVITYTDIAGYQRNDQYAVLMDIYDAIATYMKSQDEYAALITLYVDNEYKDIIENEEGVDLLKETFKTMLGFEPQITTTKTGDYDVTNIFGDGDFEGTTMTMNMSFVEIGDYVYVVQGQSNVELGEDMLADIETFIGNLKVNDAK